MSDQAMQSVPTATAKATYIRIAASQGSDCA